MKPVAQCYRSFVPLSFLFIMNLAFSVSAQHAGAGTTIFDCLNIKYDARTTAMGGAAVALPNDLYGTLTNPAAVGFITDRQAFIGNRSEAAGIWGYPLAFALPQNDKDVFAVSVVALTTGNIAVTDRGSDGSMVYTGANAAYNSFAGSLTWARKLNSFSSAGVTIKGLYDYLGQPSEYYSADGYAVDAGLQYRFMNSRLIYGLAVQNLSFMKSGYTADESYSLPSSVEMGVSFVPANIKQLRLAFDLSKKSNDYLTFAPAAELELIKNQMAVRIGLHRSWSDLKSYLAVLQGNSEDNYQQSNVSLFCAGVGFSTQMIEHKVKFDAALDFPEDMNLLPSFVISILADL
jgi:hypothetical protein